MYIKQSYYSVYIYIYIVFLFLLFLIIKSPCTSLWEVGQTHGKFHEMCLSKFGLEFSGCWEWMKWHGHDDILHELEYSFRKFHHEFQFPSILREISHRGRQILPWLKLSNCRRFEHYANWYAPICHGRKKVKPSLRKNIRLFGDLLMTVGYHHSSGNLLYLLVLSWGFWLEWECSSFRSNQDFLWGITKKSVYTH